MEMWKQRGSSSIGQMYRDTIRLSLSIPAKQHIHLKRKATKRDISMRKYILETLAFTEAAEEGIEMDRIYPYRKGLKEICKEHFQLVRNLSKR